MEFFLIAICTILIIPLSMFILRDWRRGIALVFLSLYIENGIRIALPGKPPYILAFKEAILALTYISFLFAYKGLDFPKWSEVFFLSIPTGIIGIVSGIYYGNDPVLFAIGIKGYYWYMPLAILGYRYFSSRKQLKDFCTPIIYLSSVLLIIAVLQYIYWDTGNVFVRPLSGDFHSGTLGDVPMIPGAFGSHARFARVEFLAFMLSLGFVGDRAWKAGNLWFLGLLPAFGCFLLSGYRTVMLLATFSGIAFLAYFNRRSMIKIGKYSIVFGAGFILLLFWREDLRDFIFVDTAAEIIERPLSTSASTIEAFDKYGIAGYGLGSMSQGIDYLMDSDSKPQVQKNLLDYFESGLARVGFETGILGIVGWSVFLFAFLMSCWKECKAQNRLWALRFCTGILLFLGSITVEFLLIRHQTFQDSTTMILFWFMTGVMFKIRHIPD